MLESMDFNFGGKTYKVGEAGLMFVYEIGVERGQIYVIALTEKFGTIIFYIPEEAAERIKERVQQIPYSLNDYLSFLIEFKDFEATLKPFRISGLSINDAAAALGQLSSFGIAAQDAAGSLADFAAAYREKAQEPEPVPNNWLKIHGFPMRRKGRGEKSVNKWIGSGRLTENPVIRYNGDKVSFVTFTVMCKRNKRIREGDQPVDFIDCICFGNIARLARDYLYKDKKVEIIGPLQSGHYETKDGKKVYTKTVLVEELQFAETKAEEKERQESKNQEPPEPAPPDYKFMDIPDGVDQELPFR